MIEASLTDINSPLTTFNLVNTKLNLDSIIEIARQDVTLNKLQKKIREIEFISKLQELSNRCMDKDTIINSYLDLIHVNFPVDITNIYSKKGDKYKCLASKSSTIAKVEVPMEYIKDLIKKEEPVLLNLTNNSESLTRDNDLKFVINIPINWEPHGTLNLFVATINPHSSLTEDDLNILSISMKQFILFYRELYKN